MRTKARYNIIAFIALFFLFVCLLLGAGTPAAKASASESALDYSALDYIDIPGDVDYKTEKVVLRIHCPSIRHIGDEEGYIEGFKKYVSYLSFRMSMGGQIYFVNGVACDLEDGEYGDNTTTKYAEYYEIRYYDAEKQYVYITFNNLSDLVANDIGAYEEGVCIFENNDETYTEKAKLAYLPEDPTEDPTEDENGKQGAFAWVEWRHILIAVYTFIGIIVGIVWVSNKSSDRYYRR